jgi:hypothetical protein
MVQLTPVMSDIRALADIFADVSMRTVDPKQAQHSVRDFPAEIPGNEVVLRRIPEPPTRRKQ